MYFFFFFGIEIHRLNFPMYERDLIVSRNSVSGRRIACIFSWLQNDKLFNVKVISLLVRLLPKSSVTFQNCILLAYFALSHFDWRTCTPKWKVGILAIKKNNNNKLVDCHRPIVCAKCHKITWLKLAFACDRTISSHWRERVRRNVVTHDLKHTRKQIIISLWIHCATHVRTTDTFLSHSNRSRHLNSILTFDFNTVNKTNTRVYGVRACICGVHSNNVNAPNKQLFLSCWSVYFVHFKNSHSFF